MLTQLKMMEQKTLEDIIQILKDYRQIRKDFRQIRKDYRQIRKDYRRQTPMDWGLVVSTAQALLEYDHVKLLLASPDL